MDTVKGNWSLQTSVEEAWTRLCVQSCFTRQIASTRIFPMLLVDNTNWMHAQNRRACTFRPHAQRRCLQTLVHVVLRSQMSSNPGSCCAAQPDVSKPLLILDYARSLAYTPPCFVYFDPQIKGGRLKTPRNCWIPSHVFSSIT